MNALFDYLIFPGLLFSVCVGLMSSWVDRKVSARVQWRVGPPWHQNFTDIIKLFGKEICVPPGAGLTFLAAPYVGFLAAVFAATIIGKGLGVPTGVFGADLIVVLYFLVIPAVSVLVGAASSRNPLASVGASREMKLVLAYELPFILAVVSVIIKSGGVLTIGGVVNLQASYGSNIMSWSGALAFVTAFLCTQAKLGLAPFDIAEAEQEIMGGTMIEYSGIPLAVFKLTKAVMLYAMPLLLVALFLGKDTTPAWLILKYVSLLAAIILIKNTNPRLRIDQAMKFFWGPLTLVALLSLSLALGGQ